MSIFINNKVTIKIITEFENLITFI